MGGFETESGALPLLPVEEGVSPGAEGEVDILGPGQNLRAGCLLLTARAGCCWIFRVAASCYGDKAKNWSSAIYYGAFEPSDQ